MENASACIPAGSHNNGSTLLFASAGATETGWGIAKFSDVLSNETIHAIEHLAFLLTAWLFWSVLFEHGRTGYLRQGIAIPYLFTITLHSGILDALMMFATRSWYPHYASTTPCGVLHLFKISNWLGSSCGCLEARSSACLP